MSMSRAFSTRKGRPHGGEPDKLPQRASTAGKLTGNARLVISAPIQLVHTTNMLSYSAPDIRKGHGSNKSVSSTRSDSSPNSSTFTKSDDDDDDSSSDSQADTLDSTPPASPDVADRCLALLPPDNAEELEGAAPAIPARAASHTKKNSYDAITRQQSTTRLSKASGHSSTPSQKSSTFSFSRASSTSSEGTSVHHNSAQYGYKLITPPTPPMKPLTASIHAIPEYAMPSQPVHPFDQELGQLSELVEEYGGSTEISLDDHYMHARELRKWSPSEYLGEVTGLYGNFFPETLKPTQAPLWI